MRFTTALTLTAALAFAEDGPQHATTSSGDEVVGEYEIVTTTVTTEHIDIGAGGGTCTNCVYNDFVLVLDRISIHEWAVEIKAEYDLLMRDWQRSLEHFSFEIKALNEDYWVMFRPLVKARKEIFTRRYDEVIAYVMSNTYFHGAHIHHVVPEIELFLKNEFNPVQNNIVSMFGLNALTLTEGNDMHASLQSDFEDVMTSGSWVDPENHTFTFDFDEDEVVAWFNDTAAKYEEVEKKYRQDFMTFVEEVNVAVEDYEAGADKVQGLYDTIVRNAAADADFYWQMHFDSPLEHVTGVDIDGDGSIQHTN